MPPCLSDLEVETVLSQGGEGVGGGGGVAGRRRPLVWFLKAGPRLSASSQRWIKCEASSGRTAQKCFVAVGRMARFHTEII